MASTPQQPLTNTDYTIGWICQMGVEISPVESMLDEIHQPLHTDRNRRTDTLRRLGGHNVVVAVLPKIESNGAAKVAIQLFNTFTSIRFGLLVGIGGEVSRDDGESDIRLSDIIVNQLTDMSGVMAQYDLEKGLIGGSSKRTGQVNKPLSVLNTNARKLQAQYSRVGSQILKYLLEMTQSYPKMQGQYLFPASDYNQLFLAFYEHVSGPTCDKCDQQQTILRPTRLDHESRVHYGTIGSTSLVKDPAVRDELKRDMNILCVEMEAAGLMDNFPSLVIRGVCDYADSHKNRRWQPFATTAATSCMKELLTAITPSQVAQTQTAAEIILSREFPSLDVKYWSSSVPSNHANTAPRFPWSDSKDGVKEETERKWPSAQRRVLWSCFVCHCVTAIIASGYRPRHASLEPLRETDSLRLLRHDSTFNREAFGYMFQWRVVDFLDPDPLLFLCASSAWGIITVYLIEQHRHHAYQYHFLIAGLTTSILFGALSMILEELPLYPTITYTPLWISFVMVASTTLHWFILLGGKGGKESK